MAYALHGSIAFAIAVTIAADTSTLERAETCVAVATVASQAPTWVGNVPYNHALNKTWGYPTDCSGYVSWLMNTGKDVKAFAWGSSGYSTALTDPLNELRFGDIFTHVYGTSKHPCSKTKKQSYISGHVFMFDKWADAARTEFWAFESTETYDVTAGCKNRTEPCYNHHVKKNLSTYVKWANESCATTTHGTVHGGPRRINANILCAPVNKQVVRLGFYKGAGTGSIGDLYRMIRISATQVFGSSGFNMTNLSSGAAVRRLTRDDYDIMVFPGGSGNGQASELQEKGLTAVRNFVQNGGGYIGTCGGAFLGLSHLLFYGHVKTQGYPAACHAHGCNTSVSFSSSGLKNLGLVGKKEFAGNVTIMYHNGPIVKSDDLPLNVTQVALFRAQGTPWGLEGSNVNITSTPAITSTQYGSGRVVLNSPHPEHLSGLAISAEIYAGELQFVRPKQTATYEPSWESFVV